MTETAMTSDIARFEAVMRAEFRAGFSELRADLTETIWLTVVLTNLTLLIAAMGYVQLVLK